MENGTLSIFQKVGIFFFFSMEWLDGISSLSLLVVLPGCSSMVWFLCLLSRQKCLKGTCAYAPAQEDLVTQCLFNEHQTLRRSYTSAHKPALLISPSSLRALQGRGKWPSTETILVPSPICAALVMCKDQTCPSKMSVSPRKSQGCGPQVHRPTSGLSK